MGRPELIMLIELLIKLLNKLSNLLFKDPSINLMFNHLHLHLQDLKDHLGLQDHLALEDNQVRIYIKVTII